MTPLAQEKAAFDAILSSAMDQYCPVWELINDVARLCELDHENAVEMIRSLRSKVLATPRIQFFKSAKLYGDMMEVAADEFFDFGIVNRGHISDGSSYYYIHQELLTN